MSLLQFARLDQHRSFRLDLGLAATALFAWFLLNGLQVAISCSLQVLSLGIEARHWQLHWPFGPWALAVTGLALVYLRRRFLAPEAPLAIVLQRRLQQLIRLIVVLSLLRLLSLGDFVAHLFPYLGLLWAPHATWALGLLFLVFPQVPVAAPAASGTERTGLSTRGLALLLFLFSLLVYGSYTFYFCQTTMLHGDEGQYLRVTQSLLHDGDMDLANNLDTSYTNEFHVRAFSANTAPAAPPGKVYSGHPIGLPVLLVPAYWAGLEAWQNPRLAGALFMALVAAGCVPLAFVWLIRLGVDRLIALLSTGIMAVTSPFFLYSNQLYPEVPPLLVLFLVLALLAHWQVPGGRYRSLGWWEPGILGVLVLLLAGLSFLHPRHLPVALLAGVLVLLQAWHSPHRRVCLAGVGAGLAAGLYALLAFNYAFSNDWMGPFNPENAMGPGLLKISTWPVSLPGHWLHRSKGLGNSAPVFLLALVGWAALARQRDRRLLLLIGLYGATAVFNGVNAYDWTFGYCFPARFLVTALPALLYGLAVGLRLVTDRVVAFFLTAGALTISLETVFQTLVIPESGYEGMNLARRTINFYYPWQVHFTSPAQTTFPFQDILFWGLLLLALSFAFSPGLFPRRFLRPVAILVSAFLPVAWGHTRSIDARLDMATLPILSAYSGENLDRPTIELKLIDPINPYNRLGFRYLDPTGERQPEGRYRAAAPQDSAGMLTSVRLPMLMPGFYRLVLADLETAPGEGQVPGQVVVSLRQTSPAVNRWETRFSQPLSASHQTKGVSVLEFLNDRLHLGYADVEYSGSGTLSLSACELIPFLTRGPARSALVDRLSRPDLERSVLRDVSKGDSSLALGAFHSSLPAGHYRVEFDIEGATLASWVERAPVPVRMAVFTAPPGVAENQFKSRITPWLIADMDYGEDYFTRPLAERLQAPWWSWVPWGRRAFSLHLSLSQTRDTWFLLRYAGPEPLRVEGLALYRGSILDRAEERQRAGLTLLGRLRPLDREALEESSTITVTIQTTDGFDASAVDPATLTLGNDDGNDTPVARRQDGSLYASFEDADGDGDIDLVVGFDLAQLIANGDLAGEDAGLTLNGKTADGNPFRGGDVLRLDR